MIYELAASKESDQVLANLNTFATAAKDLATIVDEIERIASMFEQIPNERQAAIDQIFAGVASERQAILSQVNDVDQLLQTTTLLSKDLAAITGSLERTAIATKLDLSPSPGEPMDLRDLLPLLQELTASIGELRALVETVDASAATGGLGRQLPSAFRAIDAEVDWWINRVFLYLLATIAFFFVALYLYRQAIARSR